MRLKKGGGGWVGNVVMGGDSGLIVEGGGKVGRGGCRGIKERLADLQDVSHL